MYFGDVDMKSKGLYLFYRVRDGISVAISRLFTWRRIVAIIVLLLVTCVGLFAFKARYSLLFIRGNSMQPSYKPQDILLCEKKIDVLKRGDIVDIDTSEEQLAQRAGASDEICKRVIALGGDTILFTDKEIYINGTMLNEPYAYLDGYRYTTFEESVEYTVPEGCVYVMGDNRVLSLDSRAYGVVSIESLNGRVVKNITSDYGFTMHKLRVTLVSIIALGVVLAIWSKLSKASKAVMYKVKTNKKS